jgi:hypothetical protein
LLNGGSHGLSDLADAFQQGLGVIPEDVQVTTA